VRGMAEEQLAALKGHEAVQSLEVHTTSLEDIFVAYMQGEEKGTGTFCRNGPSGAVHKRCQSPFPDVQEADRP
jgi:hypothetical protein